MLPEVQAELIQHLVTIVIALLSGGIGAALVNWLATKRKTAAEAKHEDAQADKAHAEAESTRINAAIKLLDEYQEDRARLVIRVSDVEENCRKLQSTINFLVEQNNELQRDKARQDTVIEAYRQTVDKVKDELAAVKRYVELLCEWIRAQGLEPPTLEELEGE